MSEELKQYDSYYPVKYDYVDQLPTGWQLLPNIGIFQERIERGYENEELLSVTIGRGVIKQSELDKKDSSTLDKSKYLLVYPNDLVYSMRFRQGASGYSNYKGIVSPACTVLRPKKDAKYNPRYFYYMFRTEFYKNYVERFAYGIADGQIPLRYVDFKRMYSIFPPIEVQNAIVAYLDEKIEKIARFISRKENLIQLLNEERNAVINKFILKGINPNVKYKSSEIDWLGDLPEHWEVKKLKFISNVFGGSTPETGNPKFWDGDIVWITPVDISKVKGCYILDSDRTITKAGLKSCSAKLVPPNTIILTTRAPIGNITLAAVKLATNQGCKSLIVKEGIPEYYYYQIEQIKDVLEELGTGTTFRELSATGLKNVFLAVPPYKEQTEIIKIIKDKTFEIEQIIEKTKKEISAINEYRESLITNLITGQKAVPM